jgi:predicted enzyme related to lactoylglutathione lyase
MRADRGSIVHVELHTGDDTEALTFLGELLGWRADDVAAAGKTYRALCVGDRVGGGIVDCGAAPAQWVPYVLVGRVARATERAGRLGATVLLEPREGPAGWRSVISTPTSGTMALWQPKT